MLQLIGRMMGIVVDHTPIRYVELIGQGKGYHRKIVIILYTIGEKREKNHSRILHVNACLQNL